MRPLHSKCGDGLRECRTPARCVRYAPRRRRLSRSTRWQPIRILGIDPGLRRTGWGMVVIDGNRLSYRSPAARSRPTTRPRSPCGSSPSTTACGRWSPSTRPTRLRSRRPSSTRTPRRRSSSARRAASRCWCRRLPALPVAEYAPNLVKKTIVGAGHCEKAQIRMMIGVLLPKADPQVPRRRRRARDRGDARAPSRRACVLKRGEGGRAMIGKLKGIIDSYGEDFIILDVNGVGYLVHCSARTLQALPAPASRRRWRSRPMCAKTRSACSASSPTSSANGSACCRPCRASAPRWRSSVLATLKPGRSRLRHRHARQGDGRAHARRRAEGRRAHRHRVEGQGAGLCRPRSGGGPALRRGRGQARAAADRRRRLGAGQSRLRSAAGRRRHCRRERSAGEGAETRAADPARIEGAGK